MEARLTGFEAVLITWILAAIAKKVAMLRKNAPE